MIHVDGSGSRNVAAPVPEHAVDSKDGVPQTCRSWMLDIAGRKDPSQAALSRSTPARVAALGNDDVSHRAALVPRLGKGPVTEEGAMAVTSMLVPYEDPRRTRAGCDGGSSPPSPATLASATPRTCACSPPGARTTGCACMRCADPIWRSSSGRWNRRVGRAPHCGRRLSKLCSFYRYCHLEGLLAHNPAANVRRPKIDPESRTLGLDRNERGALRVQARLGSPRDHALISWLAMKGAGDQRSARRTPTSTTWTSTGDHRRLQIVRKGGKERRHPVGAAYGAGTGLVHR
jgi:hypothetical protein